MPIDRNASLKQADKLLRQGKLAGAIEEYVRLVDDQPHDWNSINALGDLYLRAGDHERAVAQFTTVADHLYEEGFLPKASALYKKALKVKSDHEHSMLRLVDIAVRHGVIVDAVRHLRELARQRHDRGDRIGVEQCLVRLAKLANDSGDDALRREATRRLDELYREVGSEPLAIPLSSLIEEEDSDEPFVLTPADEPGGTALLADDGEGTAVEADEAILIETPDADLGAALAELRARALELPPMPVASSGHESARTLESVFDEMRSRVLREQQAQASEQYERGLRHLDDGRLVEAFSDLQAAARMPLMRFKAAASIGRVLASRKEYKDAVEWMERAIEAPPPSPEEGWTLMYELADALERLGEHERAMAVFVEVQSDAGAYRDVAERIELLRDGQQESPRT